MAPALRWIDQRVNLPRTQLRRPQHPTAIGSLCSACPISSCSPPRATWHPRPEPQARRLSRGRRRCPWRASPPLCATAPARSPALRHGRRAPMASPGHRSPSLASRSWLRLPAERHYHSGALICHRGRLGGGFRGGFSRLLLGSKKKKKNSEFGERRGEASPQDRLYSWKKRCRIDKQSRRGTPESGVWSGKTRRQKKRALSGQA